MKKAPTNTLAMLSLVFVFLFFPAGLVLGIVALNQIKQTHERGITLAWIAIVLSSICFLFVPVMIIVNVLVNGVQ
jgi:hypothetical protein